jgi:CheY-like chemotaxis protein
MVNQKVVVHMLEKLGQNNVVVTDNGQECLRKLETTSDPFDLIIMDMQMPIMDGITATKLIRKDAAYSRFKDVKIIGMTANGTLEDKNLCLEAGMNDYLAKPVKLSVLDGALRVHFGKN